MIITSAEIKAIMPRANAQRISEFVESFNKYNDMFGITTALRAAHYIAQVAHETGQLQWLEELASGAAYDTGAKAKQLGNTPRARRRRSAVQRSRLPSDHRPHQLPQVCREQVLQRRPDEPPRMACEATRLPEGQHVLLANARPE